MHASRVCHVQYSIQVADEVNATGVGVRPEESNSEEFIAITTGWITPTLRAPMRARTHMILWRRMQMMQLEWHY